jgi:hypothetical protein
VSKDCPPYQCGCVWFCLVGREAYYGTNGAIGGAAFVWLEMDQGMRGKPLNSRLASIEEAEARSVRGMSSGEFAA